MAAPTHEPSPPTVACGMSLPKAAKPIHCTTTPTHSMRAHTCQGRGTNDGTRQSQGPRAGSGSLSSGHNHLTQNTADQCRNYPRRCHEGGERGT